MTVVSDKVEARVNIDGTEYELIEMTSDINRYTEVDKVSPVVVDRDFEDEPSHNDRARVWVNDEKLFEGWVNQVKYKEDGSFELMLLNDLFYTKNRTVTLSITDEQTPLSEVVRTVCEDVDVDYNVDLTWETQDDDGNAVDFNIQIEETETQAAKVLDKLAKKSNSDWWFDNDNVLQFGLPDSQLHEVQYIINSDAADKLPPYRGVVVVGDSSVSEFGWEASKLKSEFPLIAEVGIVFDEERGEWFFVDEAQEPSFTLKDKQIRTKTEAEFAANKLAEELLKQVKSGKVEFVATQRNNDAEIDALDVIEVPEAFGGERYFVGRVNHDISSSDGYTITCECEGLVPGRYGVDRITVEV
jgi:hypothetical protein